MSLSGTSASLRAEARSASGRVDRDFSLRLSGREGHGTREVDHPEGCKRRRRSATGGLGAAAESTGQADRAGEVRGGALETLDRGFDRAVDPGLHIQCDFVLILESGNLKIKNSFCEKKFHPKALSNFKAILSFLSNHF